MGWYLTVLNLESSAGAASGSVFKWMPTTLVIFIYTPVLYLNTVVNAERFVVNQQLNDHVQSNSESLQRESIVVA